MAYRNEVRTVLIGGVLILRQKSVEDGPQFFLFPHGAVVLAPVKAFFSSCACQQHQSFAAMQQPAIFRVFPRWKVVDVLSQLHELCEEGVFYLVFGGREVRKG